MVSAEHRPFASDQTIDSPLTRHQQLVQQIPSRDPFQSSLYESSPTGSPSLARSTLKNQHQQQQQQQYLGQGLGQQQYSDISLNNDSPFTSGELRRPASPGMRAHHGTGGMTPSSGRSFDGRNDNASSLRSSAHNLALGNDRNYNMTQTDMTLEGLAERWQAYQAWWAKQYKEQPFYRIWTRSKWILLLSAVLLLGYSGALFAVSLGYILGHFEYSPVVMEFHSNIIYLSLAGSIMGIITAIVGLIGIFRENRIWLSWYTIILWPVFAMYISVGYIAFRRAKNHLRAHLKDEWIHSYSRDQRLLVQRQLKCCGYQDPTYFGEYDLRCFPMINLPGCQHKYNLYEDNVLTTAWTISFGLAPVQLFVMIAALMCSNHVDGMLRSGRPGLKSFKEQ
ncbi:hypothetical protein BGX33_008677 [Mortierella sp. NVP41]|nr:hypothetical protein BGX33_008677 [Mortierella sp. NVP41]